MMIDEDQWRPTMAADSENDKFKGTSMEVMKARYCDMIGPVALTKHELFAAMALQGLLSGPELRMRGTESYSSIAIVHADELLEKLSK